MVRPRHPSTSIGDTAWLLESASDHLAPPASQESDPLAAGAGDGEQIDEDSAARLTGRQKRILGGLSLGGLLAGCCIAIMIPFFPHEAQRRGLPQTYSGAVFSCYALAQLLAFPVMGRLAPRVGVSRLYNVGLATAGVTTTVFGTLPHIQDSMAFIGACFACRALEAVGTAAMHTAARAIIINQFPRSPNTAMSISETLAGLGLSLGPALGGGLYQLGGYGTPFYTLGGLMLVSSATNLWLMPSVREDTLPAAGAPRRGPPGARLLRFLSAAENWLCCSVVLVVAMYVTALDPNIEPYVRVALGVTPAELGLFFLVSAGCYTAASLVWGRLSDNISNTYVLTAPCLLVGAVGILLIPPSPLLVGLQPVWWLTMLGMVVREMTTGGAFIPIMHRMVRVCVAHGMENNLSTQAFVSAVFGAVFSIGNVVGPTLGGYITDLYGFPVAATGLAGFGVLVAIACVVGAVVTRNSLPK
ncbi:MFS-type transporter SLC18B1-like [Amphibalanus amphitrite]|uniref:MFS-type transporter SLC18B1-like n=1 Tax=Amphibalanus amphitrite TaxID=1232801 RepID=UPI001C91A6BE|nr:MFS-type transporter SLC18B1-like [Amphibalanus amphitrite]